MWFVRVDGPVPVYSFFTFSPHPKTVFPTRSGEKVTWSVRQELKHAGNNDIVAAIFQSLTRREKEIQNET
jgi:hypothetical protein